MNDFSLRRAVVCCGQAFSRVLVVWLLLGCAAVVARAQVGVSDVYERAQVGRHGVLLAVHQPATWPGDAVVALRMTPGDTVERVQAALGRSRGTQLTVNADGTASGEVWRAGAAPMPLHLSIDAGGKTDTADVQMPPVGLAGVKMRGSALATSPLLWAAAILFYFACIAILAGGRGQRRKRQLRMAVALLIVSLGLFATTVAVHPKAVLAETTVEVHAESPTLLDVRFANKDETFADVVPVDGQPMEAVLVHEPDLDAVAVARTGQRGQAGTYVADLPALPAGEYRVLTEVTHLAQGEVSRYSRGDGVTSEVHLPGAPGASAVALGGKSAGADGKPVWKAELADGHTIEVRMDAPLRAGMPFGIRVALLDAKGAQVAETGAARAVFAGDDGKLLAMARPQGEGEAAVIPFGFVVSGRVRMFVLVGGETAGFDLDVQ